MSSAENPYAPPTVDETAAVRAAPAPFGWQIADGKLFAEPLALLPMVDPYTGLIRERMTMTAVTVHHRPAWLWIFPLGLPLLALLARNGDKADCAITLLLLGLVLRGAAGLVPRSCRLRIFVTGRTFRRRRNVSRLLHALFWISFIASFRVGGRSLDIPDVAEVGFSIWLGLLLLVMVFQRRLLCRRKRGGLFEIGRVHPDALRELTASASQR